MDRDTVSGGEPDRLDMVAVETGLTVLFDAWERAVEELGGTVPGTQLRALLIVDRADGLDLSQLATELGASHAATSSLCDQMEVAGLLMRVWGIGSHREMALRATRAGKRLAAWIRDRRREAIRGVLSSMRPPDARSGCAGPRDEAAPSGMRGRYRR
jgi:DNA-binding MarR family transcriptional regulator